MSELVTDSRVCEVVRLWGDLRLPNGGFAPAHLVLDEQGLWLQDWSNPDRAVSIDVLAADPLRYRAATLSDELVVGAQTFTVPTGRGEQVRRLLWLARLGAARGAELPADDPLVEPWTDLEAHWLRAWLGPEETLLAWLHLGQRTTVASDVRGEVEVEPRFVLTTERMALVALGPVGDLKITELPAQALTVGQGSRRPVLAGDLQIWSTSENGEAFARLAPVAGMDPAARAWAVARLGRARGVRTGRLRLLLRAAVEHCEEATVLAELWSDEPSDRAPAGLARLLECHDARARLFSLWDEWRIGPEAGARLIHWGRALEPSEAGAAALLELHDHLHKAQLGAAGEGFEPAAIDLSYAGHLHARGQSEEAAALLERRLSRMPSEELRDLLPPADADLTEGAGGQSARIAVLERLATVRGDGEARHGPTLAALARLSPLVPERLEELSRAQDVGPLAARARRHLRALVEGPWTTRSSAPSAPEAETAPETVEELGARPLDEPTIEQVLRHPLSRRGHAMGSLQGLLAEVEIPDATALRSYCEPLARARPDADRAIRHARTLLGLRPVEAFVSRGDKSVGLRSYEGDYPFVLIGVAHLDEASPRHLGEAEMRFALGAELAHLRFGHSRVTSMDVWTGALTKSKASFDAVAGYLPGWRLLKMAEKASSLAGFYQSGQVEWALRRVERVTGWTPFARREAKVQTALAADPEDLIAAARLMQLTADRVGLLMCGDFHAAVRAVCLTHEGYGDVLEAADASTLPAVLGERGEGGEVRRQTLAIRVAAMIAFHLSEDWEHLRRAAAEAPADGAAEAADSPDSPGAPVEESSSGAVEPEPPSALVD